MDKDSRDYRPEDIKMDYRFVLCQKDAFVTLLSYLAVIIVTWVVAFMLCPSDPSQMTYLFGYPTWYTVGTIITVGYSVWGCIWAARSRKFTLNARGDDKEVDG